MFFGNSGDYCYICFHDLCELCNLSRRVRAQFGDDNLRTIRRSEERQRHTDQIVQIAGSRVHLVTCAQHRLENFLSCCFAIAARNGAQLRAQLAPAIKSQLPECYECVRHLVVSEVLARDERDMRHHCSARTLRGHIRQEVVRIKALAFERDKQTTWLNRAGIRAHGGENERRIARAAQAECFTHHHIVPAAHVETPAPFLTSSATMTR